MMMRYDWLRPEFLLPTRPSKVLANLCFYQRSSWKIAAIREIFTAIRVPCHENRKASREKKPLHQISLASRCVSIYFSFFCNKLQRKVSLLKRQEAKNRAKIFELIIQKTNQQPLAVAVHSIADRISVRSNISSQTKPVPVLWSQIFTRV